MSLSELTCLGVLLLFVNGVFPGSDIALTVDEHFTVYVNNGHGGLELVIIQDGVQESLGTIGSTVDYSEDYTESVKNGAIHLEFGNVEGTITLKKYDSVYEMTVDWRTVPSHRLEDCFSLGNNQWYGGPQQKRQSWPIQKLNLKEYSYVTKEADNAAIAEPYWLSSSGLFIFINSSTPLFVDQNNSKDNSVCFIAEIKPPYSSKRQINQLTYTFGISPNARTSHLHVSKRFFKTPSRVPDKRMVQHPIWSTWAEYKKSINVTIVTDFANKIMQHGFNNSQIAIDDFWETCYGSFNVDTMKFPDFKNMIDTLKKKDFRVTLWIHPFINKGCEPWYTEALQKGYFVKSETGKVDTSWWDSEGETAAYIDFTNSAARTWWYDRVTALKTKYGIDSFKCDAGETSWSPQIPVQNGDINHHPHHIMKDYVELCAKFGPMVDVRAGYGTQDLPIFMQMLDKDTDWTVNNGLPTLVTTLLQMNMNGYIFVLPDMIGGSSYNVTPSKELFIRWLQANVFMPTMQYSFAPWGYDKETIAITQKFTNLHAGHSDLIYHVMTEAAAKGLPVNPPIWWMDPTDPEAQKVWDEYLLGDGDILCAPVMNEGATSRDVYLPKGTWLAEGNPEKKFEGKRWIRDYPAPLDTLPWFKLVRTDNSS